MTKSPEDHFEELLRRQGVRKAKQSSNHGEGDDPKDLTGYAQSVLKFILSRSENAPSLPFLAHQHREATGSLEVSLPWFCEQYPDFPYYLGVAKCRGLHKVAVPDLFKRFHKLPFVEEHQMLEDRQSDDDDRPCALVFEWKGWSRFVVLHTAFRSDDVIATMLVRPAANRGGTTYVIESLESCLAARPWESSFDGAAD